MTYRVKMSVENRAKQFMPFSALPGLDEALARAEDEAESSGASRRSFTEHDINTDYDTEFNDILFNFPASSDRNEEFNEEDQ